MYLTRPEEWFALIFRRCQGSLHDLMVHIKQNLVQWLKNLGLYCSCNNKGVFFKINYICPETDQLVMAMHSLSIGYLIHR